MNHSINLTHGERSLLISAGVGLCIVSVFFTVFLVTALADGWRDSTLMGVAGVCFEVCKYLFIPLGIALACRGYLWTGGSIFSIGLLLVLVSISASLGFFNSRTNQAYEKARIESPAYQNFQKQIDIVDTKIADLQSSIAIDSTSQHAQVRREVPEKQKQLKVLQDERTGYVNNQAAINASETTSAGALFDGLAAMFSANPTEIKNNVFATVSILLELCGIAALSVAGIARVKTPNGDASDTGYSSDFNSIDSYSIEYHSEVPKVESKKPETRMSTEEVTQNSDTNPRRPGVTDQGDTATEGKHATRYNRVKNGIHNGTIKPSIRAVMKEEKVGTEVVSRWFKKLVDEGVIVKNGNRYEAVKVEA